MKKLVGKKIVITVSEGGGFDPTGGDQNFLGEVTDQDKNWIYVEPLFRHDQNVYGHNDYKAEGIWFNLDFIRSIRVVFEADEEWRRETIEQT